MFDDEDYKILNAESEKLDGEFSKLPPNEVMNALAVFNMVYHVAIANKIYEKLEETNELLGELLEALTQEDLEGQ